jgi:hypothetical protein
VDDSSSDPIHQDSLTRYPFYIDFITIKKENKRWHNPLVNYNIGFKFIKGSRIIIQNAEVCHVGDIINFMQTNITDNNYYVFDVKAVKNFESNDIIYSLNPNSVSIYNNEHLFMMWYQHRTFNRNFHFLTGFTRKTFDLIKNFSYDCTLGVCWDDNDFLLKIKSKNINIVNIFNEDYNIGGIHLYHPNAPETWDFGKECNDRLFSLKESYYNRYNYYIDVTNDYENFHNEYNKL